eukprot:6241056-Karenia_brevis.AAC.1
MAALQAVVAEQLNGDTLHHCCGLKRGIQDLGASSKRQSEVAKSILQWRWLVIDEAHDDDDDDHDHFQYN